jgi:hypothetical protein
MLDVLKTLGLEYATTNPGSSVFTYLKTLPESPPAKDFPLLNER